MITILLSKYNWLDIIYSIDFSVIENLKEKTKRQAPDEVPVEQTRHNAHDEDRV